MLENGFVILNRSLVKWEWYDDINTTRLFIHLILTANYEDRQWHGITIKRGQRVASRATLAKETGLSCQTIRTSINKLKSTSSLTSVATSEFTVYTLLNYDKYQDSNQPINQQPNQRLTNGQPATNHNETKLNKDKQSKTINKKTLEQMFDSFWTAYPKKRSKEQAKKAWGKLMPSSDLLATMLRAIAAQKKSHEWTKEDGDFIPHPATWINGHRWEDELEVGNGTDGASDKTAHSENPFENQGFGRKVGFLDTKNGD